MSARHWMGFAALLLLAACGKPAADKPAEKETETPGITLKAEEIQSLGIQTVPARAASWRQQISGYGVVMALDAIAQTDADIQTAQAAAAQSQAAASRAQSLSTGEEAAVSRELVESAQSKAVADRAALALAQRKTDSAFGHAPWHDAASRSAIMARLASGRTVLVRVTFPLGAMGNQTPPGLQITRLGVSPKSWAAGTVWEAPADNMFPGRGFFVLVDGSDLAQNEHVTAMVPMGPAQPGVIVPADALIYGESESWVYVQTQTGAFLKTRIDTAKAMGDGYFAPDGAGIRSGQPVVTRGAGLLLARETNPSSEAGD